MHGFSYITCSSCVFFGQSVPLVPDMPISGKGGITPAMTTSVSLRDAPLVYLVLTNAGKPVFYSHGSEEDVVQHMAVIQAIVSCFDDNKPLETIHSPDATIVFSNCPPLVLAAIDKQGRSVRQLKVHLALLHAQILSVLTKQQLEKQLDQRPNFDIRPLLGGTEVFLRALSRDFENGEPWSWLGALETLEMRRHARNDLNEALLKARTDSSLLYGLVLTNKLLAGVVRPKQHSLHPPDLHLVCSMLFNTSVFREGEHWVPICFPKFNPNGFLYAYITQLEAGDTAAEHNGVSTAGIKPSLVLVSPSKQGFFEMQQVAKTVQENLDPKMVQAIDYDSSKRIDCKSIDIEPICYFVYKSRPLVQFLQSQFQCSNTSESEVKLQFAQLQANMIQRRQRVSWTLVGDGTSSILGWYTPAFELYCYATTNDKEKVSTSVKRLVSWVRKHEGRLFVVDGASF